MPRKRPQAAPAALYAPRDTKADAAARKAEKRREHRDARFTGWLHAQPCAVCHQFPVEQHHQPYRSKPNWHDLKSLSLCPDHHRGVFGIHTLGKAKFERMHCVCLADIIEKLQEKYHAEYGL